MTNYAIVWINKIAFSTSNHIAIMTTAQGIYRISSSTRLTSGSINAIYAIRKSTLRTNSTYQNILHYIGAATTDSKRSIYVCARSASIRCEWKITVNREAIQKIRAATDNKRTTSTRITGNRV